MSFRGAAWRAAPAASGLVVVQADRALLTRLLDETGVQRSLPEPSWGEYVSEVLQAVAAWLAAPLQRFSSSRALWPQLVAWVLLAALVIVLALVLARWILRNAPRRAAEAAPGSSLATEPAGDPERSARDRETWRAEIERRLTAGRVQAALEAVWWWLAVSLLAQAVDPAWTSRELLAAADRRELSPLAATLDGMVYGPTRPTVPEVQRFVRRVEAALA